MALDNSERRTLQSRAKTDILHWFDQSSPTIKERGAMSRSIDGVLAKLPERDTWAEVLTVSLCNTEGLRLDIEGPTWCTFPHGDKLAVATIVPLWAKGWETLPSNAVYYDILVSFLHYVRQYIHRSQVAKVLMAAWDLDQRILHPFGSMISSQFYGLRIPVISPEDMLNKAMSGLEGGGPWEATSDMRPQCRWASVNTLDPNLHQAIFHFLRGQNLMQSSFELEAVVAFDCALQALTSLLKAGRAIGGDSHEQLCVALGLDQDEARAVTDGYVLRNSIGAHAGGWRWWDASEETEDLMPALSNTVRRAIDLAAAREPFIRQVNPTPDLWSDWLLINFNMLWSTVWINRNQ